MVRTENLLQAGGSGVLSVPVTSPVGWGQDTGTDIVTEAALIHSRLRRGPAEYASVQAD